MLRQPIQCGEKVCALTISLNKANCIFDSKIVSLESTWSWISLCFLKVNKSQGRVYTEKITARSYGVVSLDKFPRVRTDGPMAEGVRYFGHSSALLHNSL
ncbi:hypothetical protein CHARACLAT_012559 [Characodon lateralis]|uniref:Uncharacterized protein n=1 Tax=Characodon lateralis TaxID=208331 RepID=A0ABU7F2W4_9TELE|nr:hypothetical protein [Characodon lateralis]